MRALRAIFICVGSISKIERQPEKENTKKTEEQPEKKTSNPDNIKYSLKENQITDLIKELEAAIKELPKTSFYEVLEHFLLKYKINHIDFYKRARIDRKVFSAMKNNPEYQPKKETVALCCFGLQASLEDAEILFNSAGYSFSDTILWDQIIKYCIEHKIYNIDEVNQILNHAGEKYF